MNNNLFHTSQKNTTGLFMITPITDVSEYNIASAPISEHNSFKIVEKIIPKKYLLSIFGFKLGLIPQNKHFELLHCGRTTNVIADGFIFSQETIFTWKIVAYWKEKSNFNDCLKTALSNYVSDEKLQYWFEKLKR